MFTTINRTFQNSKNLRYFLRNLNTKTHERIGIIGVPFNKGQQKSGVDLAPNYLRNAGLIDTIQNISENRKIIDYGDLKFEPENLNDNVENMKNSNEVFGCNKALFCKIQDILKENDKFLMIGGDHSLGFGSIAGHLMHDPDLAVIWIDAHADINLNITSPSGNMHGMPVAFLIDELKSFWSKTPIFEWAKNRIQAKRMAYIGLRDIDPQESFLLKHLGITAFGMNDVDKYGVQNIVDMVLEKIDPENRLNYHVSFDIDVLDPTEAPSTGTPVPGGLSLREGISIMEKFSRTGRVSGIDLAEVNPKLGNENEVKRTISSTIEILKAAFGHNRLGNAREIKKFGNIIQQK